MKIGLSLAILWDYRKLNLPKAVSHAVDNLEFEAVEIHCEDPLFEGWGTEQAEETKQSIADALSVVNTEVSLHAPYHDTNIGTLNEGIRKEVIRQLKECVDTANFLDSKIITVHPGYVSSRKFKRDKVFEKMIENLKQITTYAADANVKICLENLASKEKAMGVEISELKKIVKKVNMENFGLTLDIAHANTTSEGPIKYAERLQEYVDHVHISDNTGENSHLSIGQGNIEFEKVLKKLQPYKGLIIDEGWIPTNEDPFLTHDRRELEKIMRKIQSESDIEQKIQT